MIPFFGEAPSTLTTPTRIGVSMRFASRSMYEMLYVSIVPVSRTYVHASVGRKHSSQNIRGGNRTRSHRLQVRAMRRPRWSFARKRDIAPPADHARFASGRHSTGVSVSYDA